MNKLSFFLTYTFLAPVLFGMSTTFAMEVSPQEKGKAPAVDLLAHARERINAPSTTIEELDRVFIQLNDELMRQIDRTKENIDSGKTEQTNMTELKELWDQYFNKISNHCEASLKSKPSDTEVPKTDSFDSLFKKQDVPSSSVPDVRNTAEKQEHIVDGKKIFQICLITGGLVALAIYFTNKSKQPYIPAASAA